MMAAMEVSVIRIPDGLPQWNLVIAYLRLRKAVFIDRMEWPLYDCDGIEFEQYDTVHSVYLIAHDANGVLGGARLLRTSDRIGSGRFVYSYMIRDACRSLLPGLPADLCHAPPPSDTGVWELTRLAASNSAKVGGVILLAANAFLQSEGAKCCLFLAPPAFMRMAERMGFDPQPLGDIKQNTNGRFLVFSCAVK
jgi:acyl homoserine lactone synthase